MSEKMNSELAVRVENLKKHFGKLQVLQGVNMEVERGSIYGLLGASGCGKTTLLNIIVGRQKFDGGDVYVLGNKLHGRRSNILGPRVGYMPQEIALVNSLTIKDTVFYFGRIYGMVDSLIAERYNELHSLLELPPSDRYIADCSGGQQRRVSFAVAIVHKPELVTLDEPTVGVDPLLREKLWKYINELAKKENMAVIITTHYIEECRQADKIGLIREGNILAEDNPTRLLSFYNSQSLEDVFVVLSKAQDEGTLNVIDSFEVTQLENEPNDSRIVSEFGIVRESPKISAERKNESSKAFISKRQLRAMLDKNWKQFYRNITGILFFALVPLAQICIMLSGLGRDVRNIPLGIVNDELASCYSQPSSPITAPVGSSCQFSNMSCRFLTYLNHSMISKVDYDSFEKATDDAVHGLIVGVLYIPENFSSLTEKRIDLDIRNADEFADLDLIKVWMDMSNRQIGESLKYKLIQLFMDFQKSVFDDCGFPKGAGKLPLNMNFFYGNNEEPITIYMLPAVLVTVLFIYGAITTSELIVTEKQEGVWDRTIVAGVTSLEITLSHLILQGVLAVIPIVQFIVFVFIVYQYTNLGSWWLLFLLLYLVELCGMALGYFISVVANSLIVSSVLICGISNTMIIISGFIWPLEGMPPLLRLGAKSLPFTMPIESIRNVIRKGWTIENVKVFDGILVVSLWIIIFGVLSVLLLKRGR